MTDLTALVRQGALCVFQTCADGFLTPRPRVMCPKCGGASPFYVSPRHGVYGIACRSCGLHLALGAVEVLREN